MKVLSALVAFLAACQFQSAAADGLRSEPGNNAMFLPDINGLLDGAKEQGESLKDKVMEAYTKAEETTDKVLNSDAVGDAKVSVPCDEIWKRVVTCEHSMRSNSLRMKLRRAPRVWEERSRNSLGDAETFLQRIKTSFIPWLVS